MSNKLELKDAQRKCVKDILTRKVMCIAPDCGFGKTVVALCVIRYLQKSNPGAKMLVVCTPGGVKGTWAREHLKFDQLKHLNVCPLVGTPSQRLKLLAHGDADVYCISYGNLKWLKENITAKLLKQIAVVYADEGDCLKGESSAWRKYLKQLTLTVPYRIISTATPTTKDAMDYFGLCDFLDGGKVLNVSNITQFRQQYCLAVTMGRRTMYKIRDTRTALDIENRCKPLFATYKLEGNSDVPIEEITVKQELSERSMELYKSLRDTQTMNAVIPDDEGKTLDQFQLTGKLQQLSSGFIYNDEYCRIDVDTLKNLGNLSNFNFKNKVVYDIFDDRIQALVKLVNKVQRVHIGMPIFIAYNFTHEAEQLLHHLDGAVKYESTREQDMWNNKEIPIMIGQYQRCSVSLNLQYGGNIIILYSPTFKWKDDYQIICRFARQGQPEPLVYVYRLHMVGTIDESKRLKRNIRSKNHRRFQNLIAT